MGQNHLRELLQDTEFEDSIELVSAKLHVKSKTLDAHFNASKLLLPKDIKRIQEGLCKILPINAVNVGYTMDCGKLKESVQTILEAWSELVPVLRPHLKSAVCSFEGDTIRLQVPNSSKNVFDNVGVETISEYIQNVLKPDQQIRLEVIPDSEMNLEIDESEEPLPEPADYDGRDAASSSIQAKSQPKSELLFGRPIRKCNITPMNTLAEDSGRVVVEGRLITFSEKQTKGGAKLIVLFAVSDLTNTIPCKLFTDTPQGQKLLNKLETVCNQGHWLRVRGDCVIDQYSHELCIMALDIISIQVAGRTDKAEKKRVELHLHTQLSAMDSTVVIKDLVDTAKRWGHTAFAVTDHGVIQAYPDVYQAAKAANIKSIFGLEGYLLPDCEPITSQGTFVVLELSTTGEKAEDSYITEIAAKKTSNGNITGEFHATIELPGHIRKKMQYDKTYGDQKPVMEIGQALEELNAFAAESCFVVYHAQNMQFLWVHGKRSEIEFKQKYIDLKMIAHYLLRDTGEKIENFAEALGIPFIPDSALLQAAECSAAVFAALTDKMRAEGISELPAVTQEIALNVNAKSATYHIILLVENEQGLINMYKLVSYAHLDHFYRRPRIPRSLLLMHRQGLILGSACEQGELFQALLEGQDDERLKMIARFYDYLEIQPIGNNAFMIRSGQVKDEEGLRQLNRRIVEIALNLDKPVAATGDVHFLEPQDEAFRRIIMHSQGFSDADFQAPLYFKTTDEMLEEFSYLGKNLAMQVVVDNPAMIAQRCEQLKPFPDETYPPKIDGAEEELRKLTLQRAHEVYGEVLPEVVQKRLDKELDSIIKHGFGVLYYIAYMLVKKSMSDGYIVGSRGSVGSSFVATMAGITEVNPLPPHYICPKCSYSDFNIDRNKYACGCDLPDKQCPSCGTIMKKDGYDIWFEVFLGFKGDKVPDIDLNFSGEYQPVVHKYTEELFAGRGQVFRAGTISAIKDRTAYGMVRKYLEEHNISATRAEIDRLTKGCSGVKRTTGQHPGGIVVVPKEKDVFHFTPIQHPADDDSTGIVTTHFDFKSLHDRLVKLDILGHDDPTALRMLEDLTGIKPQSIPLDDKQTMALFSSTESLGLSADDLFSEVGTYGIPEFGTGFVRQMLVDTRPTTMEELVRIAGLSHGENVWLNNAQPLVKEGIATLSEVICTRDDIMSSLLLHGMESSMAFKIMERVRKGKGLAPEMETAMNEVNMPEWFIDSCHKIKYMFPRAHAAAYVMMAFRIAYFKVHRPHAFYATYFSVRSDTFDIAQSIGGTQKVRKTVRELGKLSNDASEKDKSLLTILEVVLEMNLRGIELLPVDIYKSDATKFLIEGNAIRPPIKSLQGVGTVAAVSIAKAKENGEFLSEEDLQLRAKVGASVIKTLREANAMERLPETNQLCLF